MGCTYLAYAYALMLLCPLALSRPEATFDTNDADQSTKTRRTSPFEDDLSNTVNMDEQPQSLQPTSKQTLTPILSEEPTTKNITGMNYNESKEFSSPGPPVTVSPNVTETPTVAEPTIKRYMKEFGMSQNSSVSTTVETHPSKHVHDQPPMIKKNIDLITVFVGNLLVKRVPEDTFLDLEDGGTRNLSLLLRFGDRTQLPKTHWLQFDEEKQEMYGVPGYRDISVQEYLLTALDKKKGKRHLIFNIKVMKGPLLQPHLEFHISVDNTFMEIAYSARNKRKLIEKIAYIFGHENVTKAIKVASITDTPTTMTWYNTSLPSDRCPQEEIDEMYNVVKDGPRYFKQHVENHLHKDIKVTSIKIIPRDKCIDKGESPRELTSIYAPESAGLEPVLGAKGIVNVRVSERKLLSFIAPTLIIAVTILGSVTVLYFMRTTYEAESEFLPCLRVF